MGAGALIAAFDTPFNREVLGDSGLFFGLTEDEVGQVVQHAAAAAVSSDESGRSANRGRARSLFGLDMVSAAYEELLVAAAGQPRGQHLRIRTPWDSTGPTPG